VGTLYVVATPIGNLEDITIRAIKTLVTVPVIACEDTRHTGQLIKILEEKYKFLINLSDLMPKKYISVRDWNEREQIDTLLEVLTVSDVALVSDAGTPLLSDPGFKLVRAVKAAGIRVVPIPGACAAITALSAAGLPTNIFKFWGFLPKKYDLEPKVTHVIYESPIRLPRLLKILRERYSGIQIVLARELTKIHEYIGPDDGVDGKGEVTVLAYLGDEVATVHGEGQGDLHNGENGGSHVG
jgi:16S rRNA (cytidine1402-2'-O)-methyltransferase